MGFERAEGPFAGFLRAEPLSGSRAEPWREDFMKFALIGQDIPALIPTLLPLTLKNYGAYL